MIENQHYQEMIKLGAPVVPLMIDYLKKKPDHLFHALRQILHWGPTIAEENRGDIVAMSKIWCDWWDNRPTFSLINYNVCQYCEHLRGKDNHYDGMIAYFCDKNKDSTGHPTSLAFFETSEGLNMHSGCTQFEASGRPAHPIVYAELIQLNSRIATVEIDEEYTETSYDFSYGKYATKRL
jgi:hypothetical protein